MSVGDWLAFAKEKLSGIYEQRERDNVLYLLAEEILELKKHQLRAAWNEELAESTRAHLVQAVDLLSKNEPLQYVLGSADFYGLKLKVNKHVLIPRPETEELVDEVVRALRPLSEKKALSILDIGTGSGCIAIALKKHLPYARVTTIDSSENALSVAAENAMLQRCDVKFLNLNFLDEKGWKELGMFDVLVSNPPYVTKEEFTEMLPRVKDFEPRQALIAQGDEPFIFYRKIAMFGKTHLNKNGSIFLELNSAHAMEISAIFKKGYAQVVLKKDLQGRNRILKVA